MARSWVLSRGAAAGTPIAIAPRGKKVVGKCNSARTVSGQNSVEGNPGRPVPLGADTDQQILYRGATRDEEHVAFVCYYVRQIRGKCVHLKPCP